MPAIHKLIPCLWFDTEAEAAAQHYTSIFGNSRIKKISRYPNEGQETTGKKPGSVMTVEFELEGVAFTALNGGPHFKFNEAISFQVMCETQAEIDTYWTKLSAGGDPSAQQCGWLKDKFGLSWQIVPTMMADLFSSDPAVANRVMKAMLKMKKLDIRALEAARG